MWFWLQPTRRIPLPVSSKYVNLPLFSSLAKRYVDYFLIDLWENTIYKNEKWKKIAERGGRLFNLISIFWVDKEILEFRGLNIPYLQQWIFMFLGPFGDIRWDIIILNLLCYISQFINKKLKKKKIIFFLYMYMGNFWLILQNLITFFFFIITLSKKKILQNLITFFLLNPSLLSTYILYTQLLKLWFSKE